MSRRKTIEDCISAAEKHNGRCLSTKYTNCKGKLEWECDKGHRWFAIPLNVLYKNSWCPFCGQNAKHSIEFAKSLAEERGGKCLSNKYKNIDTHMKWECDKGHRWKTSLRVIKNGFWCPRCCYIQRGVRSRLGDGLEQSCKIATENNGKCLSNEYVGNNVKMEWQCEHGHTWSATFSSIQQGSWCPQCRISRPHLKLLKIVKSIFLDKDIRVNYKGFAWLKNQHTGGKQELDIYVCGEKLAIEYDGEQHFIPVCFGGVNKKEAEANLKIVQERDRIKNLKIKEHPEDVKYFVRFNYMEDITKKYVINKLRNIGVSI